MKRNHFVSLMGLSGLLILVIFGGMQDSPPPDTTQKASSPYVVVLGVAQDAGYPQAGCKKSCCESVWNGEVERKHVSCLALVDPRTNQRWLFDATPDFREQLRMLDEIAPPAPGSEGPALDGIFLTHAHIGHYTGLMFLGHESMGADEVNVYTMPRMRGYLSLNGPWAQLVSYKNIKLRPLKDGMPVRLTDQLFVTPIRVPHREEYSEVVGYRIDGPNAAVLFIPDIDKWEKWDQRIETLILTVDYAYIDGTFYANGEIPNRDMSQIPHPFIEESMKRFRRLPDDQRAKIRFIHLNHTNPALQKGSDAQKAVEAAGMHIAFEGERVKL